MSSWYERNSLTDDKRRAVLCMSLLTGDMKRQVARRTLMSLPNIVKPLVFHCQQKVDKSTLTAHSIKDATISLVQWN